MQPSTKYQLVVRGEHGKYTRGDCAVYDLRAQTEEDAEKEAKRFLYADPTKWEAKRKKDWRGNQVIVVDLDPGDEIRMHDDILLDGRDEPVHAAWIVEVRGHFDIKGLQQEIEDFKESKRPELENDPEYQKFLELQKKFG